jgi:hypothetical protein
MSWRSSAERALREHISPEMVAGLLVLVLALALIGILGFPQLDGTEPGPSGSTAEPAESVNRDVADPPDAVLADIRDA